MIYSGAKCTIQRNVYLLLYSNPRQTIYQATDNQGTYVEMFTI